MNPGEPENVRIIKKYPNRRYYDTTQSCHVTLDQMHALVLDGQNLHISDSKTGEDITNLILLQMILEKEQPKLEVFPSSLIHMMIRSNRQVLRSSLESMFGPLWSLLSQSQKQFESFWRQNYAGQAISPADWTSRMMQAFNPSASNSPPVAGQPEAAPPEDPAPPQDAPEPEGQDHSLEDLRRQVANLTNRIEQMNTRGFGQTGREAGASSDPGADV